MLRILFDKNVPYPLKWRLPEYQVKSAEDEDWGQISNGELISCAETSGYQIPVTCDQNVRYQQNLTHRKIAMVVLKSNIWPSIKPKIVTNKSEADIVLTVDHKDALQNNFYLRISDPETGQLLWTAKKDAAIRVAKALLASLVKQLPRTSP
ncbi:MAG: hypothetical protein M3Y57_08165 [Acidobacteriota bacterium]|nr:hypothetical protein [Acidobacteriota bacterium]